MERLILIMLRLCESFIYCENLTLKITMILSYSSSKLKKFLVRRQQQSKGLYVLSQILKPLLSGQYNSDSVQTLQ